MRRRWGKCISVNCAALLVILLLTGLTACQAGAGDSPSTGPPTLAARPPSTQASLPGTAPATQPPAVQTSPAAAGPTATAAPATPAAAVTAAVTTAAAPPLASPTSAALPATGLEQTPTASVTQAAEMSPNVSALPDPNGFTWRPLVAGLSSPVGLANAGDGSGRLFVLEQVGTIRVIRAGSLLPEPFLNIVDRVGSQGNEQGLLGLAFHPQYAQNGFFYVNYTDKNGDTVIARFQVSATNPDQADPASEVPLLRVDQPFPNHNGGVVAFGPDGYLYLGLGDGGSAGDPNGNAQSLDTLLGKILRIDVNSVSPGQPYAVPADNPFAAGGGRPEIWAYGLRNPWRFAFDRGTGDLYIADVGQNQYEEIDYLRAGSAGRLNFGWDYFEASHPYEGQPPASEVFIAPVAEYAHDQGCSITGGEVYRGTRLPEWQGVYLYGDFCSGNVWGLLRDAQGAGQAAWQNGLLYTNVGRVTSFGLDDAGEVYLVDRAGAVLQLDRK